MVRDSWRSSRRSRFSASRRSSKRPRCATTALGHRCTVAAATWARQHRSMSSPKYGMPSVKPPTVANRSDRTSRHASETANTSRGVSCCDWSSSSGLGDRRREAVRIDRVADRLQSAGIVPVDELRSDHAAVGAERLGHQRRDGVGGQSDVVVEEQVERRALDRDEHLVRRRGEATVDLEALDEGGRQDLGDAPGRVGAAAVVDDQHREALVVLVGQRLEGVLEPVARIRRDEHRDHRRGSEADQWLDRARIPIWRRARPRRTRVAAVAGGRVRRRGRRACPLPCRGGDRGWDRCPLQQAGWPVPSSAGTCDRTPRHVWRRGHGATSAWSC